MKKEIVNKRRQYVKEHIIREEIKEIAKQWGVHPSTIEKDLQYLRKNEGLKTKSQLRDNKILELWENNVSAISIADDIGVSSRNVYYRLKKKHGVN